MNSERKGLNPEAYEPVPGDQYVPYVPKEESLAEFTIKAAIVGAIFGVVFGAANAYLGLRVGLTVSTSVPVAVMTVALFKIMQPIWGKSSILEANMSQTVGSASSSLASGIIFTIPALFLWGLDPALAQLVMLGLAGGLLGTLFMIPLRRFLINQEHGKLPYPEGTACAEVLVAADAGGSHAQTVFMGLTIGAVFKFLMGMLHLWKERLSVSIPALIKSQVAIDLSPALLGVGYILGYRVSAIMVGGGLVSSVLLIPLIAHFGSGFTVPLFPESNLLISEMSSGEIWHRYIRYIGAGAVAAGGIITLVRSLPTIYQSFKIGGQEFVQRVRGKILPTKLRTDFDIPLHYVLGGVLLIVIVIAVVPHVIGTVESIPVRLVGAVCIALFAFFFTTVSSRIVGLVGVTSNPTSGMTIMTLLVTSSVFVLLGWTDDVGKVAALTVGTVVAISASIAGDTSQDLKTGFLIGATPYRQQIGEFIGVITSVFFVCIVVVTLHKVYGFGSTEMPAPQATLMKIVIEGVLSADIPWVLVLIGAGFAIIAELLSVPSLPFAVGIYLPVSTMTPIFVGGCIRHFVEKRCGTDEDKLKVRREKGVLFGSGLVAGEGIVGVAIAGVAYYLERRPEGIGFEWLGPFADIGSLIIFAGLLYLLFRATYLRKDGVEG